MPALEFTRVRVVASAMLAAKPACFDTLIQAFFTSPSLRAIAAAINTSFLSIPNRSAIFMAVSSPHWLRVLIVAIAPVLVFSNLAVL